MGTLPRVATGRYPDANCAGQVIGAEYRLLKFRGQVADRGQGNLPADTVEKLAVVQFRAIFGGPSPLTRSTIVDCGAIYEVDFPVPRHFSYANRVFQQYLPIAAAEIS
jgi:hypothetical protein